MRPNKLTLQAFGPFSGAETIDFDQLGSNPLFLINGPTGAGKSSILDAICFALYGQTTGKEREATQMRCDHASEDLPTEVMLEFTLGQHRYRIQRAPTQERPKSRGEGTTTQQTSAQLWEIKSDSEELLVPKSAVEATKAIEDLTGLNVEQFRQVMVLPQGKFREFLMADSSQRETIFSKLFQTQIYKRIEDALKLRASGISKQVEALKHQTDGILKGADLTQENDLAEELLMLEGKRAEANTQKERAIDVLKQVERGLVEAKNVSKAFQLLNSTEKEYEQLQLQRPAIAIQQAKLERAQKSQKIAHLRAHFLNQQKSLVKLDKEIADADRTLIQAKQDVSKAERALTDAEKALVSVEGIKEKASELRGLIPKVQEYSVATSALGGAQQALLVATQEYKSLREKHDSLAESLEQSGKRSQMLNALVMTLPTQKVKLDNLKEMGVQRARLDKLNTQKADLETHLKRSVIELDDAKEKVNAQQATIKTLELSWHSNQAAILAAELKQGEACPVCGSLEHPRLALATNEQKPATKEQIESARQFLSKLESERSNANGLVVRLQAELEGIVLSILQQKEWLGEYQEKTTEDLRLEWKHLNAEVNQLLAHQEELTLLDTRVKELTEQKFALVSSLEKASVVEQTAKQEVALSQQTLTRIEQELPDLYRQPGALESAVKALDDQARTLIEAHRAAQLQSKQCEQAAIEIDAKLGQAKKQQQTLTDDITEAKNRWENALRESAFSAEEDFLKALLDDAQQSLLQSQLQAFFKQIDGCEAKLLQQRQQLADATNPDLEKLNEQWEQHKVTAEKASAAWSQLDNRFQQLKAVEQKLKEARKSKVELEAEYAVFGTLSDVANGQRGDKISLQRFVLSVLLDDVLIEASHRLLAMSKGRYSLLRKEDRAKGNKASGLELEVEDAYTGKSRSVATLSGGESFMAALSLALGLSDVVQAYAGGIRLDTLFIDEGFGSLDQESLELAVRTLIDLQSGGRMIGIISHVSELREQMQLRIDVHSSTAGSKVTVSKVA